MHADFDMTVIMFAWAVQLQASSVKSGADLGCWMRILDMREPLCGRRLCDELSSGRYGAAMALQMLVQPQHAAHQVS